MRQDFAVFILSHGRGDNVITVKTLKKCGYTGPLYILIDDEDEQEDIYRRNFGDMVVQFCKRDVAEMTDTADVIEDRRSVVFARNACFDVAEKLGYRYFLELDDDYSDFAFRYVADNKLKAKSVTDMNRVCEAMLKFLDDSGADSVALAQAGDFIGGSENKNFHKHLLRKVMNSFFCDTRKRFDFVGRINEDVNTYVLRGNQGKLFFTLTDCALVQKQTQSQKGGWTEVYLERGTFVKSFYSVVFAPQAVTIGRIGTTHFRIHHNVCWNNCAPLIISERYKK